METKPVRIFKALSGENRIRILKLLHNGEPCACNPPEEPNITQPTLSHHMKLLCSCGIVKGRKEGTRMHYRIDRDGIGPVRTLMEGCRPPGTFPSTADTGKDDFMKKSAAADKTICVACGVCMKACPRGAIGIYRGCYALVDDANCVGCGLCAKACPAGCITVNERSEAR